MAISEGMLPAAKAIKEQLSRQPFMPGLIISLVFHGVILTLLYDVMQEHSGAPSPPRRFDVEFIAAHQPEPQSEPQSEPHSEPHSGQVRAQGPEEPAFFEIEASPETKAPPEPKVPADMWQPLSRDRSDGAALRSVLGQIACPRFQDPADRALAARCQGRALGQASGELFATPNDDPQFAAILAKRLERGAVDKGWAQAFVPSNPERDAAERFGRLGAPGSDTIGPMPWAEKQ